VNQSMRFHVLVPIGPIIGGTIGERKKVGAFYGKKGGGEKKKGGGGG